VNFLKKGPEIKLSGLKVPGVVADVYYDLKDRHLLPVAVILLVAIVAVPIAISDGSGSEEPLPAEAGASQGAATTTGALVAKATPGLRAYQRRLDGRGATDPFRSMGGGESEGDGGEPEAENSATGVVESGSTESSAPSTYIQPETGGGGAPAQDRLVHYSYAIDVRITGGKGDEKKTTVRKNLPALTMLPSRETPAIVYMGSTKDGKKAVMTVSSDVKAVFGDARCVLGSETCQMLAMETGLPETFVYGGAEKTYTIELLKIELIESDKLNKAPLGDPKKGKTKNRSLSLGEGMR
jgi:hypothetical protein